MCFYINTIPPGIMPEITYHIDKVESEKSGVLAIQLLDDAKTPINRLRWQQQATPRDKDPLRVLTLKDVKFDNSHLKIPYSQSVQALKLLAASGKFFFQQKQLICDFFTPVEFYYFVKNNNVTGMLKFLDQEFELTACDFICSGSSAWFIKGSLLKLIHTDVSWKDLKQLYLDSSKFSLKNLQDFNLDPSSPRIVYGDNSLEKMKHEQQPFPLLILKDRSGAFADLWMDYGHGKVYAFHDHEPQTTKRDLAAEKNWEKDLLETGFIQKLVGQSHYYCPLDQVPKSLSFLLEIGWNIQDYQKKKVLLFRDTQLDVSLQANQIFVRGKFHFDQHEANLVDVAGAFNRRERFVQMDHESVGLLPESWGSADLTSLFEEGEILNDSLKIKKSSIGSIEGIFQSAERHSIDPALNSLREGLASLSEIPSIIPGKMFRGTLRPYQQQGISWLSFLQSFGFHGMLADDMGLGKTVQVLAFLSQLEHPEPILIVMPTSLIFNWKREIERFLPHKKVILHQGTTRSQSLDSFQGNDIILTSYATMRIDLPLLSKLKFAVVILDEAQAIKNSSTQVAQAAYRLQSNFRLLLTGTPIENHLSEIWSHFHFLMPDLLGDEKQFLAELQAGNSDSRFLQRIKKKIRPFILRRKKIDVAKDLPECIEQTVWIDMTPSQKEIYEGYLAGIKNNLFKKVNSDGLAKHRLEVFEAILRLRQICCHPLLISSQLSNQVQALDSGKMEALMQDLENAIEENDKVLVYSQFTSMLSLIAKEVQTRQWNYVYLDGTTKDREKVVNQFQNDASIHLFLISLKAGGTGLNLTAADHVFIFDPWWNEAAEKQAINRAHRIGRKNTVFAKRYATVESIEEKMMSLKEKKKGMIDSVFDDSETVSQLTLEDFAYLLNL